MCDNGQSSSSIFSCGCPDCSTAKGPLQDGFCKRKQANTGDCASGQNSQSGNTNNNSSLQDGDGFQSDRHSFIPGGSFWEKVTYGGVLGVMSALFFVVILTGAYIFAGVCMHCTNKVSRIEKNIIIVPQEATLEISDNDSIPFAEETDYYARNA